MFYCSNCLFKYPAKIAFSSNAGEPATKTIRVQAIIHESPETINDNIAKSVTKQLDKQRELEKAKSVDIEVIETGTQSAESKEMFL